MNSHVKFPIHSGLAQEQQDDDAMPVALHIQTGIADTTQLATVAPSSRWRSPSAAKSLLLKAMCRIFKPCSVV